MASVMTPSSAPWRRSPASSRTRNCRSAAVARPSRPASSRRRSACEPGPASAPIWPSASVGLGQRQPRAAPGRPPRPAAADAVLAVAAQQIGQGRVADADLALGQVAGQERDCHRDLAAGTSRSSPAMCVDLGEPPGDAATAAEVRTTLSSSIGLQPAFLLRDLDGLGAVAGAELLDGGGQVIADGAG